LDPPGCRILDLDFDTRDAGIARVHNNSSDVSGDRLGGRTSHHESQGGNETKKTFSEHRYTSPERGLIRRTRTVSFGFKGPLCGIFISFFRAEVYENNETFLDILGIGSGGFYLTGCHGTSVPTGALYAGSLVRLAMARVNSAALTVTGSINNSGRLNVIRHRP
jgi:hypothetical protein